MNITFDENNENDGCKEEDISDMMFYNQSDKIRYRDIRPTFYYHGDGDSAVINGVKNENEVRAGGALFYKIENDNLYFLMIKTKDKYEDFGGKTDENDLTIYDTIAREIEEESNNIFNKNDIMERITDLKPIYAPKSKYIIFIIKLTENEKNINVLTFGDMEIHDSIYRTVEFVPYYNFKNKTFINNQLCFRLKFKNFFFFINELYNSL